MTAIAEANVIALHPRAAARPAGLLPWDDETAFAGVRGAFIEAYAPQGPAETSLVDRMVWIEWRRERLRAAEAAVHVAHAFDRAGDSQFKAKMLTRAGVTDYTIRDEVSVAEILRDTRQEDDESLAAIREGIEDIEATLALIEEGHSYEQVLARLDEDMRSWWTDALEETKDDGARKYAPTTEGLDRFLRTDGMPWRKRWLTVNEARPAIRAQAIAESFDPPRIRQLWEMEARLDRQFEKALSMLIRLQEMRVAAPA